MAVACEDPQKAMAALPTPRRGQGTHPRVGQSSFGLLTQMFSMIFESDAAAVRLCRLWAFPTHFLPAGMSPASISHEGGRNLYWWGCPSVRELPSELEVVPKIQRSSTEVHPLHFHTLPADLIPLKENGREYSQKITLQAWRMAGMLPSGTGPVAEHEARCVQVAKKPMAPGLYRELCGQQDQGSAHPTVLALLRPHLKSWIQF